MFYNEVLVDKGDVVLCSTLPSMALSRQMGAGDIWVVQRNFLCLECPMCKVTELFQYDVNDPLFSSETINIIPICSSVSQMADALIKWSKQDVIGVGNASHISAKGSPE